MKNWKTLILNTLIILALPTSYLAAQDDDDYELSFGPKAGINISNVYDAEGEDFEATSRVGYVFGGFISIPLNNFIGIQPEVLYSQKGFKSSGTFLGSAYEFNRVTTHLDIPLQLAIRPTPALTLLAGPHYSYTLSKKDKIKTDFGNAADEEEFDNDNIRKNTFGLVGGFDLNITKLILSGRAGWDLQNNDGEGNSSDIRYRNFWVQFTLGVNLL